MGLFDWLFGNVEVKEEDFSKELKDEIKKQEIEDKAYSKLVNRNIKGTKHEKEGRVDLAIKLYEKNINDNFDGSHPYNRLAIIYRKQKDYHNEIRVLNKAIEVFSNLMSTSPRLDIETKLEKFKKRLEKSKTAK
ncbi:tetratricopeptide repeat protein [Flavobacteriaceae bacterium]|nr:tetratricopeptide repeat protein [Flavobacteriaceae bacterium]